MRGWGIPLCPAQAAAQKGLHMTVVWGGCQGQGVTWQQLWRWLRQSCWLQPPLLQSLPGPCQLQGLQWQLGCLWREWLGIW